MNQKVVEILPEFYQFAESFSVKLLKKKMLEVCKEEIEYVADELLLLSEEILSQVSAFGVCLYLQKAGDSQTEKNNDYILHELFLKQGHQNAGPVFYRVCAILREITGLTEKQKELFDSDKPINKQLQELAKFRNALMHGFFKLPASRNLEIIKDIQNILEQLNREFSIFDLKADFHFWKKDGFTGHWYIGEDDTGWDSLAGNNFTLFEQLAGRAKHELYSDDFVNNVNIILNPAPEFENKDKLDNFITEFLKYHSKPSNDFKESLYVQFHPEDKDKQDEFFTNTHSSLIENPDLKIISYSIDSDGIGFTSYLLYHIICKEIGMPFPKKEIKDKIGNAVKEKRLVLLINNIHLVPFTSYHITTLMKFFKEYKICFIGIGWEYEHLNSIFSQRLNLREEKNAIPNEAAIETLLKNHTRQRGPFEKEKDFLDLNNLIKTICDLLQQKNTFIARQFADVYKVDIELINEALYILYPYLKYDQSGKDNNYIKDDLDELYGFPKSQTETSSIFLTLGRRDIDLEYKHKILKPC
jgi:hypothetical protein